MNGHEAPGGIGGVDPHPDPRSGFQSPQTPGTSRGRASSALTEKNAMITNVSDPWRAVHARLRRERGPASTYPCAEPGCDRRGREWALTFLDSSMQWGRTPGGHRAPYSDDLQNYTPRCPTHARLLDRQQAAERRDGLALTARSSRRTTVVQAIGDPAPTPSHPTLFGFVPPNDGGLT